MSYPEYENGWFFKIKLPNMVTKRNFADLFQIDIPWFGCFKEQSAKCRFAIHTTGFEMLTRSSILTKFTE